MTWEDLDSSSRTVAVGVAVVMEGKWLQRRVRWNQAIHFDLLLVYISMATNRPGMPKQAPVFPDSMPSDRHPAGNMMGTGGMHPQIKQEIVDPTFEDIKRKYNDIVTCMYMLIQVCPLH